jgi:hypothetical protein
MAYQLVMPIKEEQKGKQRDTYLAGSTPGSVEINDADAILDLLLKIGSGGNEMNHFTRSSSKRSIN